MGLIVTCLGRETASDVFLRLASTARLEDVKCVGWLANRVVRGGRGDGERGLIGLHMPLFWLLPPPLAYKTLDGSGDFMCAGEGDGKGEWRRDPKGERLGDILRGE